MRAARPARAARLSDASGFELYRLEDLDGQPLFQVALQRPAKGARVEYAVWRAGDADPSLTGAIDAPTLPWDDAARIEALRQVAREHAKPMRVDPQELAFGLPDDDEDDDEDEDEDEDEDDDEDEDEDEDEDDEDDEA